MTDRRIVLKQGFLAVRIDEVTLNSIEGAHIAQSLMGRLFNYGRLTIRGSGDTHLLFPTMADPGRFRAAAEGARIARETSAQAGGRDAIGFRYEGGFHASCTCGRSLLALLTGCVSVSKSASLRRRCAAQSVSRWWRRCCSSAWRGRTGEVSEAEFARFIEAEVTPRWKEGYTILQGRGLWYSEQRQHHRERAFARAGALP